MASYKSGIFLTKNHHMLHEGMKALLQDNDDDHYIAQFDAFYLPTVPAKHNPYAFNWHKFKKSEFKVIDNGEN